MDLIELTNDELVARLSELRGKEKESTLAILQHLIELDKRELYGELGYSSLFDYCLRALKYSEASSARRVSAARALRDNPEIAELFLAGKVTLCTIATAAKGIKEGRTEICEIVGKSKREVELLVAPVTSCPKERIRPIVREMPKVPLLVETPKEVRYTISFSVTQEVYQEFEQVKNLLSNKLGSKLSVEAIFKELLRQQLKHKNWRAKTSTPNHSRYVPKGVRQEVRARDGYQCSYLSPDGVRCSAKQFLHFDHTVPWALGGATDSANLRLRCACHNQLHAENTFGKEFMLKFKSGSTGGSNLR